MALTLPELLSLALALLDSLGMRVPMMAFVVIGLAYSTYRMFFKS